MSKFYTKVKGTTHYDIDFSNVRVGDALQLVRDPSNPFDSNAIRVLLNGAMLGHVDRALSAVLAGIIDSGGIIKTRVAKILGGPPYNYGIEVVLSVYENINRSLVKDDSRVRKALPSFQVNRSPVTIPLLSEQYLKYLFLQRTYDLGYFKSTSLPDADKYNAEIWEEVAMLDKFIDVAKFTEFRDEIRSRRLINLLGITLRCEESIKEDIGSGFVTTYELILYEKLKSKFPVYRQAIIGDYFLDFLIFDLERRRIWALEADGGVHCTLKKHSKDTQCEAFLLSKGISTMRVNNYLISKDVDSVVGKVLSEMKS